MPELAEELLAGVEDRLHRLEPWCASSAQRVIGRLLPRHADGHLASISSTLEKDTTY